MGNTDTYGVQFRATSAFTGCEVYVSAVPAEGGSLTLSLYAWAGNYAKSIAEKPCAGATVTGIRRGSWVTLPGDFKAGEYLLVLSGGSDSLAVEMREARTDRSVTYLHTSASGLSLVSRLTGTNISTEKPSMPDAQDFVSSGAWAATDGLGRTLPDSKTAGGIREGKYVGLFYHTWHASLAKTQGGIVNVSEIVAKYPEAVRDYDHPRGAASQPVSGTSRCSATITTASTAGFCASTQSFWQMPGWMSCSSTTPTEQKTSSAPS